MIIQESKRNYSLRHLKEPLGKRFALFAKSLINQFLVRFLKGKALRKVFVTRPPRERGYYESEALGKSLTFSEYNRLLRVDIDAWNAYIHSMTDSTRGFHDENV